MRRFLLATTLLALGLIVGCTSEPAANTSARVAVSPGLGPTWSSMLSDAQQAELFAAEQSAIADCMQARGFFYQPASWNPVAEARRFPYGIDDEAWARQYGLGNAAAVLVAQLQRDDPSTRYIDRLDPARQQQAIEALHGQDSDVQLSAEMVDGGQSTRSANGCVAKAEGQIYGNAQEYFSGSQLLTSIKLQAEQVALNSPEYQHSLLDWSACMASKGRPFRTPADVEAAYPAQPGQTTATSDEVIVAISEAQCVNSTGLAQTGEEVASEWTETQATMHENVLLPFRARIEQALGALA